jgi:hypothetical protein
MLMSWADILVCYVNQPASCYHCTIQLSCFLNHWDFCLSGYLYDIYIWMFFFSVQQDQLGKMHYAYGAGQHAGLSIVLDAKEAEYFAPLQPMTGIWVRHFWFLYHALLLHVYERPTNASNLFKVFIPLFVCSYMFRHHLCHLQGAYMYLSYLHVLSRCW